MIYLSTGGFKHLLISEIVRFLKDTGIRSLELSSGPHHKNLNEELTSLKNKGFNFVFHNYFPVPSKPFVFNLASKNRDIINLSMQHAMNAIKLSNLFDLKFYSFHAGFLIDPLPEELGKISKNSSIINRNEGLKIFINNLEKLEAFASEYDVKLMVENNVYSANTHKNFGENPLLFVDPKGAEEFLELLPKNIGILCDFAHLKVSANTLNFSPQNFLDLINEKVIAAHLSDNDSIEDLNLHFDHNAWFFEFLRKDLQYYSVEVYDNDLRKLALSFDSVQNFIFNDT